MTHITFLFALVFSILPSNKKQHLYLFTIFSLFLFLAFRYDYGNDYMGYMEIHSNLNSGLLTHGNDFLFSILNRLIPNFFIFVAVSSLIYIFCTSFLIYKNLGKKYAWLGFLILLINPYLFLVHLSSFRQTLAICAFILSIHFLIKKKHFLCYFFILIAVGFHKSALVLLIVPFLINDKKLHWNHFILLFLSLFVLSATPLLEIMIERTIVWIPQFRPYMFYLEGGSRNSLRATVLSFLFLLFVLFYINRLRGSEIIYGKLSLVSFYLSVIAYKVSMITRVSMYFEIFTIVTLPMILIKNRSSITCKIYFLLLFIIYLIRYIAFFNNPMWESYLYYKSVFTLLF